MPSLELIIMFAAGALVIPALFLGVWLVVKILDIRDRRRALYSHVRSVKFKDSVPDIREYPVKIEKIRKGYRINFYDYNDNDELHLIHTVEIEKVDRSLRG